MLQSLLRLAQPCPIMQKMTLNPNAFLGHPLAVARTFRGLRLAASNRLHYSEQCSEQAPSGTSRAPTFEI
jgi:hypothetical protein